MHEQLGNISQAARDYTLSIENDPLHYQSYTNLGKLKIEKMQDTLASITHFNRALEINPFYENAIINKAVTFEKLHMVADALNTYQKGLELLPGSKIILRYKAMLHHKQGNHELALNHLDAAVRIDPRYGEAYYLKSIIYFNLGDPDQAKELAIRRLNFYLQLKKNWP